MSEQNKNTSAVDWAEKLKASMENTSAEPETTASPAEVEDDLAALLRAQLGLSRESSTYADELDTSEFEEEYEEEPEEEYEEEPEEEYEDESEEEYEEEPEEKYEDEPEEEYEDEPEEEIVEISVAAVADASASTASLREPEAPAVRYLSDDRLNGLTFEERMGGDRLRRIDEENTLLLKEAHPTSTREIRFTEASPVDPVAEEGGEASADADASTGATAEGRPRVHAQLRDALQVDLDSFLPPVTPLKKNKGKDAVSPTKQRESDEIRYAPHMTEDSETAPLRDTAVCLELGYEAELRTGEPQRLDAVLDATAIKEALDSEETEPATPGNVEYPDCTGHPDPSDTEVMERGYAKARRWTLLRLGFACLGTLCCLLYDLLPALLGTPEAESLWDTPCYALVGMGLFVVLLIPHMPRLAGGVKGLVTFAPSLYSTAALSTLAVLLYGGAACLAADPDRMPLLFGCAFLTLLVTVVAELWLAEGERRGFAVASSGKTTYMLTDEPTPASAELSAWRAEANGAGAPVSAGPVFTAVRAGRVADHAARTGKYNPYAARMNYLLPAVLLAAILCAGVAILLGEDPLWDSIRAFTVAYLLCLPMAYASALALPLKRANGTLQQKGAAVLGAAAPTDYAKGKNATLLFPDGDAVKALHRKEIVLRADPRAEECRRMANIVFRMLQMPLGVEPPMGDRSLDGYRIRIAEADGEYLRLYLICEDAELTTEIMMGTHGELTRRGVRLPKINMEKRYKKNEKCHVVYLAFDRRFHLAYAAEYRVGLTFARGVSALSAGGDSAAIYTYDPMVSEDIEGIALLQKRNGIRVLSPTDCEGLRGARSSGVIATGRSLDLIYPFAACRAMQKAYRHGLLLSWLTIPCGTALTALAVCLGQIGLLTALPIVLWQAAVTTLTVLWTVLTVSGKRIGLTGDKSSDTSRG